MYVCIFNRFACDYSMINQINVLTGDKWSFESLIHPDVHLKQ